MSSGLEFGYWLPPLWVGGENPYQTSPYYDDYGNYIGPDRTPAQDPQDGKAEKSGFPKIAALLLASVGLAYLLN